MVVGGFVTGGNVRQRKDSSMGFLSKGISPLSAKVGHFSILLYSPSGAGKTTTATTMPGKVAYLSTEPQGGLSVKDKMIAMGRPEDDISIFSIEDQLDENGDIVKHNGRELTARRYLDVLLDELERSPGKFTSVVLDSITDAQNGIVRAMKMSKGGLHKALNQQEWGYIIDSTRELCIRLRNLKMHTCVIALANEIADDQQRMVYRPNLVGKKLPQDIPQYFNLVAFMRKDHERGESQERYYALTRSNSDVIYTKAHPALDAEETPNISGWFDKINAYWASKGQGEMPTESGVTVKEEEEKISPADKKLMERLQNAKIVSLYERLGYDRDLQIAGLKKYRNDDKLIEVLSTKLEEKLAKEGAEAAVEEASP